MRTKQFSAKAPNNRFEHTAGSGRPRSSQNMLFYVSQCYGDGVNFVNSSQEYLFLFPLVQKV